MDVPWYRMHRLLSPTAWALPCVTIFELNSFLGWRCVSCKAWAVHWTGHRNEVYVKMFHYVQTLWMVFFQTVEVRKWVNGLFFFFFFFFLPSSHILKHPMSTNQPHLYAHSLWWLQVQYILIIDVGYFPPFSCPSFLVLPSVPTKLFVRRLLTQLFVSIEGG